MSVASSSAGGGGGGGYMISTPKDAVRRIRSRDATFSSLWFRDDAEFEVNDAVQLLDALAEDGRASSIRSVCIGGGLQYVLACAANDETGDVEVDGDRLDDDDFGGGDEVAGRGCGGSNRSSSSNSNSSDGTTAGSSLSLSALLERVGSLPLLQELLMESDDRITQFASAAALLDIFGALVPPIRRHLRRIHVDSVLNVSSGSLAYASDALRGMTSLCELTLSQLHFSSPTRRQDDSDDDDNNNNSGGGDHQHPPLELLSIVDSLATLPNLRCLGLGCVVDRPGRSAFTPRCIRVLCWSSSLHTLKLDSFRLTDDHMEAFRLALQASPRGGGGRRCPSSSSPPATPPPSLALERLYLCRCENRDLTERGCRSLLGMLEGPACPVRHLFLSPAALRTAWRSGNPSQFSEQARLLCVLNDAQRGLARAEQQQQDQLTALDKPSRRQDVWLKYLSKCNHDVNISFAVLVKNPFLFSPSDRPRRRRTTTTITTLAAATTTTTTQTTASSPQAMTTETTMTRAPMDEETETTTTTTTTMMTTATTPDMKTDGEPPIDGESATNGRAPSNGEGRMNGKAAPSVDGGGSCFPTPWRLSKRQRTGSASSSESPQEGDEETGGPPLSGQGGIPHDPASVHEWGVG